jgi:hypothetical protein
MLRDTKLAFMLSVIMLNVIMLSYVAIKATKDEQLLTYFAAVLVTMENNLVIFTPIFNVIKLFSLPQNDTCFAVWPKSIIYN